MRAIRICFLLLIFPLLCIAEDWLLTLHGGGASYCDEEGCFGPSGVAYGGTFGRTIGSRWTAEVEATLACTWEDIAPRTDPVTGIVFIPELERTRFWSGVTLLRRLSEAESHFFVALGAVAGYEQQKVVASSSDVSYTRERESGLRAGLAAGAGYQWWFAENWAFRPEARFYLFFQDDLSALRYTAGIVRRF